MMWPAIRSLSAAERGQAAFGTQSNSQPGHWAGPPACSAAETGAALLACANWLGGAGAYFGPVDDRIELGIRQCVQ